MTRAATYLAKAERDLDAVLGKDHPLRDVVLGLARDPRTSTTRRQVVSFFRYLRALGREPDQATADDLEAWLATDTWLGRESRVCSIRRVYRTAVELGLLEHDPFRRVHHGESAWQRMRLASEDVTAVARRVVEAAADPEKGLRARRDLVIFALALWREQTSYRLAGLRCEHIEMGADGPMTLREPSMPPEQLPPPVAAAIRGLWEALRLRRVHVVPEDALLPALGGRVYLDWLGSDRAILGPMTPSGIVQAVDDWVPASLGLRRADGRGFLPLAWFAQRTGTDLSPFLTPPEGQRRITLGSTSAVEPRISTRRAA
ncbi:MAG TPA: hypothetical protein VF494_01535 [Candidatus Limnocylindrales bacterium]